MVFAAALGWLATGLLPAVLADAGHPVLAASDLATHSFSIRHFVASSGFVALALAVDSKLNHSWDRLAVAASGLAIATALLLLAWLMTSGIAFGDVLLVAFTVAVPLYLSVFAAAVTAVAALVAAAAIVAARAAWLGPARSPTLPLAPALLVGWLCGLTAA